MPLKDKILKLRVNKKNSTLDEAQYILTYKPDSKTDKAAKTSHALLSALSGSGVVVLELNSSLFYVPDKEKEGYIFRSIELAKKLELGYKYGKVPASGTPGLFERILGKTRPNAHELIILIPAESWISESILDLILPYGARYYMTAKPSVDGSFLEAFSNMTDMEKLEHFRIIAFDLGILGHMGINSSLLTMDEIGKLLGIT